MRVAVMGSGSFGTAMGLVLADAGNEVVMWAREPEVAESINERHENEMYHPGLELNPAMVATNDPEVALEGAKVVFLSVPAQVLREALTNWVPLIPKDALIVTTMKGVELGTTMRMTEVIEDVTGFPTDQIAVISGPNLAREVIQRQPTAVTTACTSKENAQLLADIVTTDYFRPYWTPDVLGAELGGSVKNVIALANGMAAGQGMGENSQSSLITRGLAEMTRLGVALGANPMTFLGLAGIGDLVATCTSSLSRNRTFGESLGKGNSVEYTLNNLNQTCEGYKSCQSILDLAKANGVEMPIAEQVVQVVHHGMDPKEMLNNLMTRDTKAEQGSGHADI